MRKYGSRTSVILALNCLRDPPPDDPTEIGFVGYLDVHFLLRELMSLCYKVLPASKRRGLMKMPMLKTESKITVSNSEVNILSDRVNLIVPVYCIGPAYLIAFYYC